MSFENQMLDAIEAMVNNAVDTAQFDRTIQGVILECTDQTIGKYKVQFQDSTFYAFATSSEVHYSKGSSVYILIPRNDMSEEKTILGAVDKLGLDYAVSLEDDLAYELLGNNVISSSEIFELCSYDKANLITLYDKNDEDINKLQIDLTGAEQYIRESSSLVCAAEFKTNLPNEQQSRGNYGIIFELVFLDNASEDLITRQYLIGVNQMSGNPYRLKTFTRQNKVFDIDGANFQYINKISIFNQNFPNTKEGKPTDIFIRNIELNGGTKIAESELSSYGIVILTPQGSYFDITDLEDASRALKAQVRVKGQIVDTKSQTIPFYWFRENSTVSPSSEKYNSYGGSGWECLNSYNIVQQEDGLDTIVEWNSADENYIVLKSNCAGRETRFKCVAVYDDYALEKEITITNYASDYDITIESDQGTLFYYDIGYPNLTCLVNGQIKTDSNFTYVWTRLDNNQQFSIYSETPTLNEEYNNAVAAYNELQDKIKNEETSAEAAASQLQEYLTIIEKYDTIMRVEKNRIYSLPIREIVNFSEYKCSAYYNGILIGTGSITLVNSLENDNAYTLTINNGIDIFKYDEAGVSPTHQSLDNPKIIKPLSFTIYNNLGQELDQSILSKCKIRWIAPYKNTLIETEDLNANGIIDEDNNTITFEDILLLTYKISSSYRVGEVDNQIKLEVIYKEMVLSAQTNFTFVKDGETGTNGTKYSCRIVPNFAEGDTLVGKYPMVYTYSGDNNYYLNYTPKNINKWFKVELWKNDELLYSGTESQTSSEGTLVSVKWSILKNKYTNSISDDSMLIVNPSTGEFSLDTTSFENINQVSNIIKCTVIYDGITYYYTYPLIIGVFGSKDYYMELKEHTGFKYVLYSADGRFPQYDKDNPFTINVYKTIDGIQSNISLLEQENKVSYYWEITGGTYNSLNSIWEYGSSLELLSQRDLLSNQYKVKPADSYNGDKVNNMIHCHAINSAGNLIGHLYIPIHFYLNRYGQGYLNDWDGNSIEIDNEGGKILAPQVGAGVKDDTNGFTGVLMGQVKEVGHANPQTGLFGYNQGQRTIFLNAENGSALFGAGNGQIIINPNSVINEETGEMENPKALLYSKNFWKNYDIDGLPVNYKSSNENGEGLLIDLSTPEIRFGNGNFSVNQNGVMEVHQAIIGGDNNIDGAALIADSIATDKITGLDDKLTLIQENAEDIAQIQLEQDQIILSVEEIKSQEISDTSYEDYFYTDNALDNGLIELNIQGASLLTPSLEEDANALTRDIKMITGDIKVVVMNKNIFDGRYETGSLNNDGTLISQAGYYRSMNFLPVSAHRTDSELSLLTEEESEGSYNYHTTWLCSVNGENRNVNWFQYDKNKNLIPNTIILNSSIAELSIETKYIKITCASTSIAENELSMIQIEKYTQPISDENPAIASEYVPHEENIFTISLGENFLGEVYGFNDILQITPQGNTLYKTLGKNESYTTEEYNTETFYATEMNTDGTIKEGSIVYYQDEDSAINLTIPVGQLEYPNLFLDVNHIYITTNLENVISDITYYNNASESNILRDMAQIAIDNDKVAIRVSSVESDVKDAQNAADNANNAAAAANSQINEMTSEFTTGGLRISKTGSNFLSVYDNFGVKIYNSKKLIAIFGNKGTGIKNLIVEQTFQFQNIKFGQSETTSIKRHGVKTIVPIDWLENTIQTIEDLKDEEDTDDFVGLEIKGDE